MKKKILGTTISMIICALFFTGCCFHEWKEATCTEPKTCSKCGETEGEALGHQWVDATCTEPKTCSVCGETKGEALGHDIAEWKVTKKASCTEEGQESGKCKTCGKTIEKTIEKTEHSPGDWVVTKEPSIDSPGERTKSCSVCGEVLETESIELSAEEKEANFKNSCESFTYDQIARNPADYYLKPAVYTGKVVQVMEDSSGTAFRINITPTSYGGYEDTIYVQFDKDDLEGSSRILDDDIVTVWGNNADTISYTTVMGAKMTIPAVVGKYIEVVG